MKILYILLSIITLWSQAYAWDPFWVSRITENLRNWWNDLVWTADGIAWYIIWLFYFIAVMVWIYWWFLILVSWWDEEKVKKWKNYVIYMIIWLIIIFLSSVIVRWINDIMTNGGIVK